MGVCLRDLKDLCRLLRVGVLLLVGGLLLTAAATGQDETPLPLFELAPGQMEASGFAFVAANAGDGLLFWADDGRRGRELWFTNGTDAGTHLWADVCPGDCAMDLRREQRIKEVAFDGVTAFFLTEDGLHGKELWWSRGTAHSTRLAADICPGDCDPQIRQLALIGGKAYFEAWTSDFGGEPWISDGTRQGTYQLADLTEGSLGSFPQMFLPFGEGAVFLASSQATAREWWQTDGTPEGTGLLADLCPGDCSILGVQAVPFGDGILFAALLTDTQQFNLYRATPGAALERLQTLCQGSHCGLSEGPMVQLGERVYMTRDGRVWSSDGTAAGTRVEVQLPDTAWTIVDLALLNDGTLLLMVNDNSTDLRVYRSRFGELSGPLLQLGFRSSLHGLGDQAVIVNPTAASVDLWSTDGTTQGTVLYEQINSEGGWGDLSGFPTVLGDQVVLSVRPRDDYQLAELVGTGGAGTPLRTLWAVEERPDSLQPRDLVSVGPRIVFRDVIEDQLKDDLWAVDDSGNTQRIATEVEPEDLVAVQLAEGKRAFFASGDEYDDRTPWLSDGTPDGTFALNDPTGSVLTWGREPVVLGGELFFLADQGAGQKLWKTGVEEDSVELVVDLQPDYGNVHVGCPICSPPIPPTPIFPRELHAVGQGPNARLVFVGGQDASGAELWQSDGTEAGTSILFDLMPGEMGSEPEDLVPAGQGLIFTADVGEGREMFLWDGQSASPEALDRNQEVWATVHNAARAVWIERHEEGHFGIGISDGTPSGTRYPATVPANTIPERSVVLYDERLFFVAADNVGAELRVVHLDRVGSDVVQRFDLWPGHHGSFPQELHLIGDQLYFSADDSVSGRELWRLDLGDNDLQPVRLGEVAPGLEPSSPRDMALLETPRPDFPSDFVLFSADDGEVGRELWVVPFLGNSAACQTDATTLCLRQGRFRVTANWRDEIGGTEGVGQVVTAGPETGFFWFFEPNNLELTVKIIDGRDFNEAHWVFYGALSDVAYDITVEDLATGARRTYSNAQGNFCGQGDIEAFPETDAADLGFPKLGFSEVPGTSKIASKIDLSEVPGTSKTGTSKIGGCTSDFRQHCLLDRFEVTVDWTDHDGNSGIGRAASSNGQTGLFWFFNQDNIELAVKAIDGTDFNDSFWIFYGALTDVRYTLRVVDTFTGNEVVYENQAGNLCGRGDTSAFPMTP